MDRVNDLFALADTARGLLDELIAEGVHDKHMVDAKGNLSNRCSWTLSGVGGMHKDVR